MIASGQLLNEISKRYRLNSRDMRKIAPLVDKERGDVMRIYARFSGDEPEYSQRVWQRVIAQRQDFEASLQGDLTNAQMSALRAVRTKVEGQMLKLLVADYMIYLDQSLELDNWQLDDIAFLFETENTQIYAEFTRHFSNPTLLLNVIEKIQQKTQDQMRKILNDIQWRDYQSLCQADEIVGILG